MVPTAVGGYWGRKCSGWIESNNQMKILDIPQCGKLGTIVGQGGRFGQIRRTLAIPSNPQTPDQTSVRAALTVAAKNWRNLTEPQRAAWIAAASASSQSPHGHLRPA